MRIKICGVTSAADAVACADAGATAIGVNLVHGSPRRVSVEAAVRVAGSVKGRVLVVGIVADQSVAELRALRDRIGCDALQLHGSEPPAAVEALLPNAYKAVRVATADDVAIADTYPGDLLLVDAKVPGKLGGTGQRIEWSLVESLARRRSLILAGGLTPENVAEAVRVVRPAWVDVASGVEVDGRPGVKDVERVRAFIQAAGSV